jgi:hypothetical protein
MSATANDRRIIMADTEDTNTSIEIEDGVDGCGHAIDEAEAVPDEDLPTAVGGVE